MVEAAGLAMERVDLLWSLDMHYAGQTHTVAVPLARPDSGITVAAVRQAFETAYQASFSRLLPGVPARIVNLRTAAIGRRPVFDLATLAPGADASLDRALVGQRLVWFAGAWHDTAVYDRLVLPVGAEIDGPAILEQPDATTVVDPGLRARVDRFGNVIVERRA